MLIFQVTILLFQEADEEDSDGVEEEEVMKLRFQNIHPCMHMRALPYVCNAMYEYTCVIVYLIVEHCINHSVVFLVYLETEF